MIQIAGLKTANSADELEDTGLQRHDEHRTDSERCTHQHADHQHDHFDSEFDRADGDLRQLFPENDHQRIARSAAECRDHVDDRRERENELPYQGADNTGRHTARSREQAEDLDPDIRKDRNDQDVQHGSESYLPLPDQVDCDDDHADDEAAGAETESGFITQPDGQRVPGVCADGSGKYAERISQSVHRQSQDTDTETFDIFL